MNSTNSTTYGASSVYVHDLQGHIIPRNFRPGFIVLSYFVSYVGAWTTLELIHRRTSIKGVYNWFLLVGSSITMGGIAVWSMHFIGNRAIVLGEGEPAIQIVYSPAFTILSFFVPVVVVFLAFATVGAANDSISLTRLTLGGALAGFGICGMHYLGQAGISNYDCIYNSICVVAAAVIAILASVGALVTFFVYRTSWRTSWWKRACCALLLASAVSGMHWVASVGTYYRLRLVDPRLAKTLSRSSTVVIVLVLSVVACFILLLFMFIAQRRIIMLAKRAQQVVVAVAVFDTDGRILVSAEGLLPSKKVTNAWLEQSLNDTFNVSHPVFLWMFRTSRNWRGIVNLIPAMRSHINQIGLRGILGTNEENLLDDEGSPIEHYTLVFRELFCVAAADLAASLHQPLEKVGILYDEMLATGKGVEENIPNNKRPGAKPRKSAATTTSAEDLELESLGATGKGQLLFLVSRVGRREAESFQAAGYRFASIPHVINIMSNSLQVKPNPLTRRLDIMREYVSEPHMLDPGAHVAIFAIRASLGPGRHGFDLLARRDAKNQLPTMQLTTEPLEDWQWDYIKSMDTFPLAVCMKTINKATKASNPSKKEQAFAKLLLKCLETLKEEIEDPFVNDALLIGKPIEAPCRAESPDSRPGTAQLIAFTIIVPIHGRAPGRKLMFEPLSFFNMQQHVYPHSPDHDAFARKTYREYKAVLNLGAGGKSEGGSFPTILSLSGSGGSRQGSSQQDRSTEDLCNQTPVVTPTRTKIRFWDRKSRINVNEVSPNPGEPDSPVRNLLSPDALSNMGQADAKKSAEEEEKDQKTYVDELFTLTIQKKGAVR